MVAGYVSGMTTTPKAATKFDAVMRAQGRKDAWLAKQVGKTRRTIQNWRKGSPPISKANAMAVAQILGVTVEEVFA